MSPTLPSEQIAPLSTAESPLASEARFPSIDLADDPVAPDFVNWLRKLFKAFNSWGEPEPDDATQYGSYVRKAGEVAAYLGHADLYEESLKIAVELPPQVFGFTSPACSQQDAYSFFAKCIDRCHDVGSSSACRKPSADLTAVGAGRSNGLGQKPMDPRHENALEWEKQARTRLGPDASDREVYDWARSRRNDFNLTLVDSFGTFARYLRAGRAWRRKNIDSIMTLPSDRPRRG